MVKKIICFVGVIAALFSLVVMPISALDFAVDNTTVAYDPILDNYPYANCLPFPYRFGSPTTVSGITITPNSDTSITLDGIATATSYNVISKMYLPVGTYTLSGIPLGTTQQMWTTVRTPQGNYYRSGETITFKVVNADDLIEVLISVFNGYIVDNETFKPMLSKGNVAFTWSPYLPYQLKVMEEQVYDEGYEEGVIDGKAEYADIAENNGKVNFFSMPQLKVSVSCLFSGMVDNNISTTDYVNKTYINNDLQFVYSNGKLVLPTIYDEIAAFINPYESDRTTFENIIFDFYFERSSNLYEDNFFPKTQNVGLNVDLSLIPNVGNSHRFNMTSFECFIPVEGEPDGTTIGQVNTLNQGVFVAADLDKAFTHMQVELVNSPIGSGVPFWLQNNLAFITNCVGYSSVYQDGYIVGYEDGITEVGEDIYSNGLQTGLAEGYENGYIQGKADGINVSENGNFVQLFTAVAEAPVNAFMGLFDFEILGLDMRGAFGAILALCVVLIVIKKVVF